MESSMQKEHVSEPQGGGAKKPARHRTETGGGSDTRSPSLKTTLIHCNVDRSVSCSSSSAPLKRHQITADCPLHCVYGQL